MKTKTEYQGCCYKCGKKKYGTKYLGEAITLSIRTCPFCKEKTNIIPALDWAGYGD